METAEPPAVSTARSSILVLAALAVLLSRLLFLPQTLEDIDSTNFARALVDYDPGQHQPHPPGYPVYVAIARGVQALVGEPGRALAALSAVSQAALLYALLALFRGLGAGAASPWATLLTLSCPVLWFNGARPMSDSAGMLFIVTTQALLLRALQDPKLLPMASLLAGLSVGARLQSVFLSGPLWVYAVARGRGQRLRSGLALLAGGAVWAWPLVTLSGGLDRYLSAFGGTMAEAASWEPLLSGFTLNRAAHTLARTLLGPWAQPAFGGVMLALAGAGLVVAALRKPALLGLGLLAFLPYLLVHILLQDSGAGRYSLPYVPLFALLAAEAVTAGAGRLPARLAVWARCLGFLGLAGWGAALTLPALYAYAGTPSPPYAAIRELVRVAQPTDRFVVASHPAFAGYLDEAAPGVERLRERRPGQAVPRLMEYWKGGGDKEVLFLGEPQRTDLDSIDPRARRSLGRWRWPFDATRFLSGARPNSAELWRIGVPGFFAADGFLLSLEAGKPADLIRQPERHAYLRALDQPGFLIVSGEPVGPAAQHTLELLLEGAPLASASCGEPLLQGFLLAPAAAAGRYLELLARTRRGGVQEGAPFALRGLDYAAQGVPGFAHGAGWFYPETDEEQRPFQWTSVRARSLVHVPEPGARLTVEGVAPLEYVGAGGRVELSVDGERVAGATLGQREFRLEAPLLPAADGFRDVLIETERVFVPDRVQRNGDRRRLGLRVYSFRVDAR